jgi:hypothetical protein
VCAAFGLPLAAHRSSELPIACGSPGRSIKTVLHLSGFLGTVQETASSVSRQIDDSLDKPILGETEQTPPSPALISGPGFGFAQSTRRDLIASQRQGGGSGTLLM